MFAAFLAIVLSAGAWAGQGNVGNPGVIPPGASYGGMTYAEWSAEWWQWLIGTPVAENPWSANHECAFGASAKNGRVLFLVSDLHASDTTTVRQCSIPVGKALLFPIYNVECSNVEPDPFFLDLAAAHPEACVEKFFDPSYHFRTVRNLRVEIDGRSLRNLEEYLFQSELFEFALPPEGANYLDVPADACENHDGCQAIAEGYWIILPPLSKGQHTIEIYAETWNEPPPPTPPTLRRYVHTMYELTVGGKHQVTRQGRGRP
jgi:hypothetical protein